METSFPSPRPSTYGDYSGKTTLNSANFGGTLASIMEVPSESFPKSALVTPDFMAQQEICYTGAHQAGTATQKLIDSALSALTSYDDTMPSPRKEQPAFIPRPAGKNTLFSKGLVLSFYYVSNTCLPPL
jgi:hypothetical protein